MGGKKRTQVAGSSQLPASPPSLLEFLFYVVGSGFAPIFVMETETHNGKVRPDTCTGLSMSVHEGCSARCYEATKCVENGITRERRMMLGAYLKEGGIL